MFFKRSKYNLTKLRRHCLLSKSLKECFKIMYFLHTKNVGMLMLEKISPTDIIEVKYLMSKYILFFNTCKTMSTNIKEISGNYNTYETLDNRISFRDIGYRKRIIIEVIYKNSFFSTFSWYKIKDLEVKINNIRIDTEYQKDIIFFANYTKYLSLLRDQLGKNWKDIEDSVKFRNLIQSL